VKGRIRTIKPEAAADEALWDLGQGSGLPVFQAFFMLICYADRAGRFEWRPRALKAACLPYWEGDFGIVLDALADKGLLVRYEVEGKAYGLIRNFGKHQVPNKREPESTIPCPECLHVHACAEQCTHIKESASRASLPFPSLPVPDQDPPDRLGSRDGDDPPTSCARESSPPPPLENHDQLAPLPALRALAINGDPTSPEPRQATSAPPAASTARPKSESHPLRNDPLAPAHRRPDVVAAFDSYKLWVGMPGAKLTAFDQRAVLLRDRLDTYGPDSFDLVLLGASRDPWVQGKQDGSEHKRLEYLLGSQSPAKYEELMAAGTKLREREKPKTRERRPPPRETAEPVLSAADILSGVKRAQEAIAAKTSQNRLVCDGDIPGVRALG